ncbi:MAG: hypothetical protein PHN37_02965 [Candidatus Pacebacteria bacterium]|nr:hypothetical protein [Candidatus Paceibacterota bacterium]
MQIMPFQKIIDLIAQAGRKRETIEIYYPKTDNNPEGWREVEPYYLSTDIGEEGEHLIYGQDRISPGHIFNAYTISNKDKHYGSFIITKIKVVRLTGRKFRPRNGWQVEF